MKITAIILLSSCLTASAKGYSQKITFSGRDVPLEEVFTAIKKQTGYVVFYEYSILAEAKKVTVDVKNVAVEKLLDECFKLQPFTYAIEGKTILVTRKEASIITEQIPHPPPPIDVKGRVVNEKGEPVESATVTVKGTKNATATDANGFFTLKGVDENAVLIITAVNIEEYSVKINGKTDLATLIIKTKVVSGEEIRVNTGYQILKPNEVTGSVVVITKEQLGERVAPDIISKLEGITNGLVFNKKATSGENQLRIRGESTLFGYTEPLIIVDNFPFDGDINSINPNDVESITILKDAAAASIWGVQAGNGVIVITTRKGKLNQPIRIELNTNTTISEKPDLFYVPSIRPSDFIDLEAFLFNKGKYTADLNNVNKIAVSPVIEILNNRKLGLISAADSALQIDGLRNFDYRKDYLKYIYRNSISQQYHMNISGGSNKTSYYFSAGYDKSLATEIGNEGRRVTLNSRATYYPFKNFELQMGLDYSDGTSITNSTTNISNFYPYMQLADGNGNPIAIPQHRKKFEDTIQNHAFYDWKYFPLNEKNFRNNKTKTFNTKFFLGVKFKILRDLVWELNYQYQRGTIKSTKLLTEESYEIRNNLNKFAVLTNGNFITSNYPTGGRLNLNSTDQDFHYGRFVLKYNHNWKIHSVVAIAGVEARENRKENYGSTYYGYDDETGSYSSPNFNTAFATYPSGTGYISGIQNDAGLSYSATISRFRSYFGNTSYTFKERYIVYGSIRLDGSNYFGVTTNNKVVPLWSTGIKWDISKERFYKMGKLPNLSLRATYGYNGNLAPNVAAITTIAYNGSTSTLTQLRWASINNIPNPELRWEKIAQFNIGIDFATIGSRVSGSIEYFHKNGNDLIGEAPLDPTTGVTQLTGNFSGMKSNGIDIQLSSKNIDKVLKWRSSLIFNYASEIVTKYDVPHAPNFYLTAFTSVKPQVGKPLYRLFSFEWAGLDPLNGDPRVFMSDTISKNYTTGALNSLKESDLIYSGRYNPPVTGSLLNSFAWKGLSFSFNITYKLNYYFRRNSIEYIQLISTANGWQNGHLDFAKRWQKPGDEIRTNIPSLIYPFPANNQTRENFYAQSDILVEKGDHIRLQYINLTYNVSRKLLNRVKIQNLAIYFYANNLGILWRANDKKIDPDYPYINYPPSKTYSIGIRTNF